MSSNALKYLLKRKFLLSILLHIMHGFLFEKSKLYFPYTVNRNLLLIKSDLFKYYLSACFIFLGMPYALSKFSPKKYYSARSVTDNRYSSRKPIEFHVGSYLSGLSIILTGFCPSYLPMYLAISPILFLYSIATSYTTFIFFYVFGKLFFNRTNLRPINSEVNTTASSASNEKDGLFNIGRIVLLSIGIILLLVFETSEQSISAGHNLDELLDLIHSGDYLPPGLTGLMCGFVNFLLIFVCDEYQTFTSEWLINIFYYTSDFQLDKTFITGQLCFEQILKVFAMAFGVRLSLWTSQLREVPLIDWQYYLAIGFGSICSAFSMCLTTATISDHIYLVHAYIGGISTDIIACTSLSAWLMLYLAKIIGL